MSIPILIINLKNQPDSLTRTFNELYKLSELSNNVTRMNAVNGLDAEKLKHKYISKEVERNIQSIESTVILPTWKSVGCAISHIRCWEYMLKIGLEYAMIMEDDVKINDVDSVLYSINESLGLLNSKLYKNIFISLKSKSNLIPSGFSNNIKNYHQQFTGTSCYFINKNCVEFLLKHLRIITYQIDIEISRLFLKYAKNYDIYGIYHESGIDNYNHVSTVQYHFISYTYLAKIIQSSNYFLPNELIYLRKNHLKQHI